MHYGHNKNVMVLEHTVGEYFLQLWDDGALKQGRNLRSHHKIKTFNYISILNSMVNIALVK